MTFFSRIIKPLLALTLAAAMMSSLQGCSQGSKPAEQKPTEQSPAAAAKKAEPGSPRTVAITVNEKGYEPSPITLEKGEPVKLVLTRTTDATCATEIILEEHGVNVPLPLNKPVEVTFTPTQSGKLVYGCAKGKMISGVLMVD